MKAVWAPGSAWQRSYVAPACQMLRAYAAKVVAAYPVAQHEYFMANVYPWM